MTMTTSKPHLELFYFDSCPYCQLVLRALKDLKIEVVYRDILADSQSMNRLLKDTGRKTVPCLYIDQKPMHESADIVAWLKKNQAQLTKAN